jgi:putative phage-type endonuclease
MTSPEQQLRRERLTGLGGSDAGAVLGVNPFRTPLDLYREKIGEAEPQPDTKATIRGRMLETFVRQEYRKLTKRQIYRVPEMLVHPEHPCLIAHLDGKIVGDTERGVGVFEAKVPAMWTFAKMKREGLPISYSVQMQHYLAVTGYGWGSYAVFNADLWELVHFDVERDEQFIDQLVRQELEFWNKYVVAKEPPPTVNVEFKVDLPKVEGELVMRNDPDWQETARRYVEALALREDAENLVQAGKDQLKSLMGGYGAVEGAGLRCYFSQRAGRKTFDKKALANAKPLDREKVFAVVSGMVAKGELEPHDGRDVIKALGDGGCELELEAFDKIGDPYDDFRTYPVAVPRAPED